MKHKACRRITPVLQAREMASRNLHTAQVTGSISVAPTPIAQSGVWNWSTSPLEGVAVLESVSVSVPPGSPGLVAPGSRMISTEPGPREVEKRRDSMRTGERREPVCRMDFNRIVNVARTPDPDYGSGGWGFEFLRARGGVRVQQQQGLGGFNERGQPPILVNRLGCPALMLPLRGFREPVRVLLRV